MEHGQNHLNFLINSKKDLVVLWKGGITMKDPFEIRNPKAKFAVSVIGIAVGMATTIGYAVDAKDARAEIKRSKFVVLSNTDDDEEDEE
jgi:hypothetical protein